MRLQAVRGAVQIKDNTENDITDGTQNLMRTLLDENYIEERHIVSVQFSVTQDLTKLNPAAAFRQQGYSKTPLFCCQEPQIEASMPLVIRVLLTVYTEEGVLLRPCYLNGAEKLRPDLG